MPARYDFYSLWSRFKLKLSRKKTNKQTNENYPCVRGIQEGMTGLCYYYGELKCCRPKPDYAQLFLYSLWELYNSLHYQNYYNIFLANSYIATMMYLRRPSGIPETLCYFLLICKTLSVITTDLFAKALIHYFDL